MPWHKPQLFRSCVLASVSLLRGNSPSTTSFLALRAGFTFFEGVLTRAELGSQWDTHKGDPRPGTSMSCRWADHSQPASASPEFSSASRCPWTSKSLVLPRGEQDTLAHTPSHWRAVLGLTGMEVTFCTAAPMVLCFEFVAKAVLITH